MLKVLLHHITAVHRIEKQHLSLSTQLGKCRMGIAPDNTYYRNWKPALRFVTARRVAFELRLRVSSPWSDEDDEEAEFFAGDIPAADRVTAKDDSDSRLTAIYGSVLHTGEVKQHNGRHTLWRTSTELETRFVVLRECALLLYKERVVVRFRSLSHSTPGHKQSSVQASSLGSRPVYQFAGC